MKILVKFPTRDRPIRFFETLELYYSMADDIDNMYFFISCDVDDVSMNNEDIINKFKKYKNLTVKYGSNKNKIEAVNSNINEIIDGYDIILLAFDDMLPRVRGYDNIIRNKMSEKYPDLDGVLWFDDGLKGDLLNTLCIMGVEYFKRFGYIYHPSYKSFYCDDEFTEVSKQLGKCSYFDDIIIEHVHRVKYDEVNDDLYNLNRKYYPEDEKNYKNRKKEKFSNILNIFFDKIYCINLDRRKDRWEKVKEQFDRIGLNVERFPAVDGDLINSPTHLKNGEYGCLLSHKNIIEFCKDNNIKNVLIFEDDIIIREEILDAFKYNISNIKKWDILYFGGNHKKLPIYISNGLYKIRYTHTTSSYALNNSLYDTILKLIEQNEKQIDVILSDIQTKYDCFLLTSYDEHNNQLVFQLDGYSDIQKKYKNYHQMKRELK